METSRRTFLTGSMSALAALTARQSSADPLGFPIGCQTYPVRDALGKDIDGTLRDIHGMGYRMIEMCSPQGYEKGGYGPLASLKASELRKKIEGAGLGCESSHYTFRELKENLPERIQYAKDLGLKQMILASMGVRPEGSMADWSRAAGDLNKIAEEIRKAGMRTGFHNHDGEFKKIDGVLIYDKLMSELDPKLVGMQFQMSVVRLGVDPLPIFDKYSGRFVSLHLQDCAGADKIVAIGKGDIKWKDVFAKAKKAGIKNYFVELDRNQMADSYNYLHGLKV